MVQVTGVFVGKVAVHSTGGQEWQSGIYKARVDGPVDVGTDNLVGDQQSDLVHHGGPDRAVLVFGNSHYPRYEKELGISIEPGAFGENLAVDTLTEKDVCLGDTWSVGEVLLEVSQPRVACFKMSRRIGVEGFHLKAIEDGVGGWYCRVLKTGRVQSGDEMKLVARPYPEWPVTEAFQTYMDAKRGADAAVLLKLPCLSTLWKESLTRFTSVQR